MKSIDEGNGSLLKNFTVYGSSIMTATAKRKRISLFCSQAGVVEALNPSDTSSAKNTRPLPTFN